MQKSGGATNWLLMLALSNEAAGGVLGGVQPIYRFVVFNKNGQWTTRMNKEKAVRSQSHDGRARPRSHDSSPRPSVASLMRMRVQGAKCPCLNGCIPFLKKASFDGELRGSSRDSKHARALARAVSGERDGSERRQIIGTHLQESPIGIDRQLEYGSRRNSAHKILPDTESRTGRAP